MWVQAGTALVSLFFFLFFFTQCSPCYKRHPSLQFVPWENTCRIFQTGRLECAATVKKACKMCDLCSGLFIFLVSVLSERKKLSMDIYLRYPEWIHNMVDPCLSAAIFAVALTLLPCPQRHIMWKARWTEKSSLPFLAHKLWWTKLLPIWQNQHHPYKAIKCE